HWKKLSAAFFEGAGHAYAHIISVIIVATTFAAGITASGLIKQFAEATSHYPAALTLAAVLLPWFFAFISGTGVGIGAPMIQVIVPIAQQIGLDAIRIGALVTISAQFGRTSSPVAPIVMLCAALSGMHPLDLLRRVWPPLLAG